MSKTRDSGQPARTLQNQTKADVAGANFSDSPPLRPRPKLLIMTGILLVATFIALLAMYFATVYPNRNKPQSVETDQPTPGAER